jgi:hypothetical protein
MHWKSVPNQFGWVPDHYAVRRDVARDDRPSAYDRAVTDPNAAQNHRSSPDPYVIPDQDVAARCRTSDKISRWRVGLIKRKGRDQVEPVVATKHDHHILSD